VNDDSMCHKLSVSKYVLSWCFIFNSFFGENGVYIGSQIRKALIILYSLQCKNGLFNIYLGLYIFLSVM